MTPRPRLALGKRRPLRNPERHLQALAKWADGFSGFFPDAGPSVVWHEHLPADQRLVDPTVAPDIKRRALRSLIDAAHHLATSPSRDGRGVVYAAIFLPDSFMSEVGVFLDDDYARQFELRSGPGQVWTPLHGRSCLAEFGLELPEGFVERGFHEMSGEEDDRFEQEVWIIREPLPD